MMETRTFASFTWSKPEADQIGPDGEVVVPEGKPILETLQRLMVKYGFDVTTVEPHDSYGWYFETAVDDLKVWSMLQFSEPWLLITQVRLGWVQRLKGVRAEPALAKVCAALNAGLHELPEANDVQWFTRETFQRNRGTGGADKP